MREGPLAELFRKTEAAQRAQEAGAPEPELAPTRAPRPRSTRPSSTFRTSRASRSRAGAGSRAAPERSVRRGGAGGSVTAEAAACAPPPATSRRCSSLRRGSIASASKGAAYIAAIRVVGVGGAGLNAIHRMMDAGIAQVDFVAVNTDRQALAISDAPIKIAIGEGLTHGLGSGADPAWAGLRPRRRSTS